MKFDLHKQTCEGCHFYFTFLWKDRWQSPMLNNFQLIWTSFYYICMLPNWEIGYNWVSCQLTFLVIEYVINIFGNSHWLYIGYSIFYLFFIFGFLGFYHKLRFNVLGLMTYWTITRSSK
jgi:hypothetical protein